MLQTTPHEAIPTTICSDTESRTARIRALNDAFRNNPFLGGGRFIVTIGIATELRDTERKELIQRLVSYDDFTPDNDPNGEHDFGSLTINDHRIFWKMDYYDKALQMGSPDPSDPAVTCRVLTVMLASEY